MIYHTFFYATDALPELIKAVSQGQITLELALKIAVYSAEDQREFLLAHLTGTILRL